MVVSDFDISIRGDFSKKPTVPNRAEYLRFRESIRRDLSKKRVLYQIASYLFNLEKSQNARAIFLASATRKATLGNSNSSELIRHNLLATPKRKTRALSRWAERDRLSPSLSGRAGMK